MKTLHQNVKIPACSNGTIARADGVFSYIDSDFDSWGTDKKSPKTEAAEVAVLEMTENGTFAQMFGSISKDTNSMAMTQAQIVEFVKSHSDLLANYWYTFFLFKLSDEFFVASVYLVSRGGPYVYAFRFSDGGVWGAGGRLRIVVPQLDLKTSPLILSISDTLSLKARVSAIERWIRGVKDQLT